MLVISVLSELTNFLSSLLTDSNPNEYKAIAPLAIMAGAAAVQAGVGAYQSIKAGKKKVDNSAEKAAMANMVANQKQLIGRAKMREAIGGEMPGMSRTEEKIGSKNSVLFPVRTNLSP